MKTRSVKWVIMAMALLSMAMPFTAKAQDKVEASAGVDLVSGYVWRGQDLGGVSLQPSASIAYKGFSLGAWGSVGIESSDTKEFDLILGYSTGGFSVSVTDYWYNVTGDGVTAKYFQYGAHNAANSHLFEAQIGYDFGPVAVNWYTNFAGDDGVDKDGDRAYSSYISVAAPFHTGRSGLDGRDRRYPLGHGLLWSQRICRMRRQPGSIKRHQNHRFLLPPVVCQSNLESKV